MMTCKSNQKQAGVVLPAGTRGGWTEGGTTLLEVLMAVGVGSLVLTGVMVMFVSGLINFTGLGNYTDLSNQSRLALDLISRDIREATQVVSWTSNALGQTLVLTNSTKATQTTYIWTPTNGLVTCAESGLPDRTYLTGCDSLSLSFFQRTPSTNWGFFTTTNLSACKLINMSWKCSRKVTWLRVNTENLVTAQIVLRGKR
jgi:hypothetical protein